ncbi:ninjurin-2 isoform X1 [Dromiciops gliroides]|uniref:ninjurin-2 isoform X1 n=2 Tax=Dromiciops gliroides TaxID=33562 RepID=UPI001CC4C99A|nr:ninjurin-2 isoform X1 [Dromiciops gliroides]
MPLDCLRLLILYLGLTTPSSTQRVSSSSQPSTMNQLLPRNPSPRRELPINFNHYATKKSVSESMLDVALFMSNATRLKAVLEQEPSSPYYTILVTLLSISLLLQVVIGILLIITARMNLNEVSKQQRLGQLNNTTMVMVFITVIINIFITAFGVQKMGQPWPTPRPY